MSRLAILLGAILALCAPVGLAHAQDATIQQPSTNRQILVMLRLPAPHFRPNTSYSGAYGDKASASARRRIAAAIARRNGLTIEDSWPMPLIGVDCFVMRVPEDNTVDDMVTRLNGDRQVLWAQPMQLYHAQGSMQSEGDPLYAVQPAASAWRLADLHRVATGRGITVAVIDSKVEASHPDLIGQFAASRDFVVGHPSGAEQHGTGIAGVIGAKSGNALGIAGVAPGARMLALRACWQVRPTVAVPTVCDTLSLAKALHFAIDSDAKVINLSLSGPFDPLLARLVSIALSRHVSVVAAYDPSLPKGGFPASEAGVVAVTDQVLPSRPAGVYGALGRDVPTTQAGGKWYFVNGSSYAAAHVSGLLALTREERRTASPRIVTAPGARGNIDACATLLPISTNCDCSCSLQIAVAKRR
ncbi:S8 family serine peptidase [Sphingomonas sp. 7/4-4]|uniref:S8 family peptidase n=1 Tax=Sphingomonas sp. 7/4-4 TaxID=3018446 RepID=UPI0022F3B285|nr:S8 family serine peptidase [Sphingomonas sp. 7/4-4]WBY08733.1 S8 family serine peptidase [Sphingomonas sp. 7/4-4]